MIKKYRKKPIVIEAVKYTEENYKEIENFVGANRLGFQWGTLRIKTLEGAMSVQFGDFVIKGINGEFYPCKPDIFKKTHDENLC